ncbi:MAG TPA: Fur family transcriptional regulator [Thermoanaerobaculaceae bacterium]|nr:Fur family transcriptional regulator [Thermoanaerobaculaceae bacterium]HRS14948.1 Fur family transcriptional regulator [Thermoanaerobaculaceae bacterium]
MDDLMALLRRHGIQPTPQRLAVAEHVLASREHPTADEVWTRVQASCPTISRATVYNTLNLLAEKGLVRTHTLHDGVAVFDGNAEPHHHLIDEETGEVYDVPWAALRVSGVQELEGFEISEYHVVVRGRPKRG